MISADFVLIVHVLNNLLDNALKYSSKESPLEVRARQAANQVQIAVLDRGIGIPEEDLEKVFDKFYRVQRPEQVTGTGLGLAICKGIVEAHGGRIWAEGAGRGRNMHDDRAAGSGGEMSEKTPRILVVDDERPIRRFLSASLSGQYEIVQAATGEDAIRSVATERPDLVILDLGLPDIDGVEVTRRLREWTQTPIIIVSVREQEGDKIAALDAGADDYLTKPFGAGELMARIRVALRRTAPIAEDAVFQSDNLSVDLARRVVSVVGQDIFLTPTEYDILRALIQHAGKVLTHRQLLRTVWGNAYESETHLLRVNVSNLRRKIERDPAKPQHIITEPGVGYRLRIAGSSLVKSE